MPASSNRSLFLQVGADVSPLQAQMKAGKTAILSLADTAGDVQQEVQKQLAAISADPNTLRQIEQSYKATFDNVRRNAQAALAVNDNASALKLIDAQGAQQAAAAAAAQAAELRIAADAAAAVANRQGEAGAAARVFAAALEVQAVDAARVSAALRGQADVLAEVAAEAKIAGAREDEVSGAHGRLGASGLVAEHVVRAFSDSIAAGQSPLRALTLEMGRITEAMTLFAQQSGATEGKIAAFANFMGGPYGLAISVAVALLVPLISELAEAGDKVEEETKKLRDNAEQSEASRQAKERFARSVEALTQAIHEQIDAQKKAIEGERTEAENAEISARANYNEALSIREKTKARLEDAKAQLAVVSTPGASDARLAPARDETQAAVTQLDEQLKQADARVKEARGAVNNAQVSLAAEQAKRNADPVARINKLYDDQERAARNAARGNAELTASLGKLLNSYELMRKAAVEAEQKRQSAANRSSNNDEMGRSIDFAGAKSIVEGVGGRVTSAPTRSLAEQERLYGRYQAYLNGTGPWAPLAAKPGTSLHGTGQAVDVAKSAGITLGVLKQAFKEAGVHLTEALDEGDHYHLGYGKKGPSAETVARRERAQVTRGANDDRAFTNADRQADDAISRAKQQLSGSIDDDYKLRREQIEADLAAKDRALKDEVTAGRLSQAQADQLRLKNTEAAILQDQIAAEQRRLATVNADYRDAQAASSARLALLQIDAALAVTRRDGLAIDRQILDEEQSRRRADVQHTIDTAQPGSREQVTAQAELGRLPALDQRENRQFNDNHLDPLEAYKKQLQGNVGDMNDALKGIEADGLKGLTDGLTGIVTGTETVASAFKKMASSIISDLVRIAAEKAILSLLGFKDGGAVGSVTPQAHAGGGFITGAGGATSDSILSWLSNGEFVVNAAATQKHLPLLKAINDNQMPGFADGGYIGSLPSIPTRYPALPSAAAIAAPAPPVQFIHVVTDKSPYFHTEVQRTAAPLAQAALIGGAAQAQQEIADQRAASIPV